jgi:hypothetical protein
MLIASRTNLKQLVLPQDEVVPLRALLPCAVGSESLPPGTFNVKGILLPGIVLSGSEDAAEIARPGDPVLGLLARVHDGGEVDVWPPGVYEMLAPSFNAIGLSKAFDEGELDLHVGGDGRLAHVPGDPPAAKLLERTSASRIVIEF